MAVPASNPWQTLGATTGAIAGIADRVRISGHRDDPMSGNPDIDASDGSRQRDRSVGPDRVPFVQPGAMPLSVSSLTAFPFFARWASPMPRST